MRRRVVTGPRRRRRPRPDATMDPPFGSAMIRAQVTGTLERPAGGATGGWRRLDADPRSRGRRGTGSARVTSRSCAWPGADPPPQPACDRRRRGRLDRRGRASGLARRDPLRHRRSRPPSPDERRRRRTDPQREHAGRAGGHRCGRRRCRRRPRCRPPARTGRRRPAVDRAGGRGPRRCDGHGHRASTRSSSSTGRTSSRSRTAADTGAARRRRSSAPTSCAAPTRRPRRPIPRRHRRLQPRPAPRAGRASSRGRRRRGEPQDHDPDRPRPRRPDARRCARSSRPTTRSARQVARGRAAVRRRRDEPGIGRAIADEALGQGASVEVDGRSTGLDVATTRSPSASRPSR